MNKDVLFGWLDQSKIDYVELKEPPDSSELAVILKKDRISILIHKITNSLEFQTTYPFNKEITDKFFSLDDGAKNKIFDELITLLTSIDIRHSIIQDKGEKFFGYSTQIYLNEGASIQDLFNSYKKILEIRNLMSYRMMVIFSN